VIESVGRFGEQHRGDTLGTDCRCPCGLPITAHKWRQAQVGNSRPFSRSSATLRKMFLGHEARLAVRRPQPFCLTLLLTCVARQNMDLLMTASVFDAMSHTAMMPRPWMKATIVSQDESFLRSLRAHRYLLRPRRSGCLAAALPMVKPDIAHAAGPPRTLPSGCAPMGPPPEARDAPSSTASGSPPRRAGGQNEVVDKVTQLGHALCLIDDLLIQPEPPG
jgi:hypothetical protein